MDAADRWIAQSESKKRTKKNRKRQKKDKILHFTLQEDRFEVKGKAAYYRYLETEHWKIVRRKMFAQAKSTCQVCGNKKTQLNVHHLNYNHLWEERRKDLEVLCRECHRREHFGPPEQRAFPSKKQKRREKQKRLHKRWRERDDNAVKLSKKDKRKLRKQQAKDSSWSALKRPRNVLRGSPEQQHLNECARERVDNG